MELDISVHKGSTDRPVVIFIHGLGMDKHFWLDPVNTHVLGKSIPMKAFAASRPRPGAIQRGNKYTIGNVPDNIHNLWSALRDQGFNLVCWSQRRPVGPIHTAVEELEEITRLISRIFHRKSLALVCHSRGGLIARKFMEKKCSGIKTLITLCTPHRGSSLSVMGSYLSPLPAFFKKILPGDMHGTVADVIKRAGNLIEGPALKELTPGSDFFRKLKDTPQRGIHYLSFGGRKTALVTVYKWKRIEGTFYPRPVIVIPDSVLKIVPASIIPDEIRDGKGDFMVTAKSSVLPWAERHYTLRANHISITWNRNVITHVRETLETL